MTETEREKWVRWLEHGISGDIFTMHLERYAWKRMREITRANPDLDTIKSYFWEWLFDVYAKTQAQAVRRQADRDPRSASLARLVTEVGEHPELIQRDWWIALPNGQDEDDRRYWRGVYEARWQERFGGGEHFDPAVAEADLARLQDESEKVRDYVNRHVAHLDASVVGGLPEVPERSKAELPTLDEVHEAIDLVGEFFNKYSFLLKGASWHRLTPVLQHDWEAVFRIPWIQPTENDRDRIWRQYRARQAAEDEAD